MEYFTAHITDDKGNDVAYIASNNSIDPLDYYDYYTQLCVTESNYESYMQMQRYFWKIIGDAEFANLQLPKIKNQSKNLTVIWNVNTKN